MGEGHRNDKIGCTWRPLGHGQENRDIHTTSNYTFSTPFNACKNEEMIPLAHDPCSPSLQPLASTVTFAAAQSDSPASVL